MKNKLYAIFILIPILLSSCIQFPVVSTLTPASSLSGKEIYLKIGNSARNFNFQARKGIYKQEFWGIDTGIFISYALPDRFYRSFSVAFDTKLSLFENSKNVFGIGNEIIYLLVRITNQPANLSENSIYFVLPIYMESSMTEWFRFMVNSRLFLKLASFQENRYNFPIVSVNVGVEFFRILWIEGYLISGEGIRAFPIPGISISYTLSF